MTALLMDLVSKQYERKRWALRDFSLRMDTGVLGLVGPNGAGKTTLLRILATLLEPTQGTVRWKGQDIVRHPETLRQELGYLPQSFDAYPQLTAREFLHYIGELKRMKGSLLKRRISTVLEMVNLHNDADRRLRTFSGGMIRRLGIAQAVINEPRLLILDEPTTGLDPQERVRFREMIASLQGEHLVILSTHIITDIEAMAMNIALIQNGCLLWNGTVDGLLADASESVWTLTTTLPDFELLRTKYQVSTAIRRGGAQVEARFISRTCPHQLALPVDATLEEAYLLFVGKEDSPQLMSTTV